MSHHITIETDGFTDQVGEILRGVTQLFANQLVTAWAEIEEAADEETGEKKLSFTASIVERKIEAKLSGSRKFAYKDAIFVEDPRQQKLGLEEGEEGTPR